MSEANPTHALDHHETVTSTGIPNKILMWALRFGLYVFRTLDLHPFDLSENFRNGQWHPS